MAENDPEAVKRFIERQKALYDFHKHRNRSQPGEQRRDVLASEMSGDGLGDEVQGATVLLAAGFNGGKHRF
ncbi:MAG TPA: hypothetical protein VG826_01385, partial [Pirellulales bacterium]|nr:hypothetical protein [Pirellulales bacterium]